MTCFFSPSQVLPRPAACAGMFALLAALVSAAALPPAGAQSSGRSGTWAGRQSLLLPQPNVAPRGFTVELIAENMHRFGNMPLRVRAEPTGPTFRDDRELTFRLLVEPTSVAPREHGANYRFSLHLPAGSGPVSQTFYLPKWVLGGEFEVDVLEAGQPLEGYRGEISPGSGRGDAWETAWMQSAHSSFCWVAEPGAIPLDQAGAAEEVADLRVLLATIAPELVALEPMSRREASWLLLRQYGQSAGIDYRTAEQVPTDWRGIGQSQVWITHWSTYRWLAEQRPAAELALRQFVRCGGTLWLLGVDPDTLNDHFAAAWDPTDFGAAKDAATGGAETAAATPAAEAQPPSPPLAIFGPNARHPYGHTLLPRRDLVELAASQTRGASQTQVAQDNLIWLTSGRGGDAGNQVFARQLGVGLIVGCSSAASLPGTLDQWQAMLQQSQERPSSVLTRGVDPVAGDARFWQWVIPGVAQPPVYTFIGLLGVFVILVGPVAYRKLNRIGRSYLMFFVAPALAALTTVLLFGYGLVADGLGTQARVRQVTWLCDRDGGAMRYWRSTYFAGLRPSGGLTFPGDSQVQPYHLGGFMSWDEMSRGEGAPAGTVTLEDDRLHLSSGFLPSRQQRQFVGYRPLERHGGLSWDDSPAGGPQVRNSLEYPLRELTLRGRDGQYWGAIDVPAGGAATLTPLDPITATRTLSELYARNRPEPPPGMQLSGRRGGRQSDLVNLLSNTPPWLNTSVGQRASGGDGVLEWWLQNTLQTESSLRAGTFIALADVTEECVAVESARLVQSVHYVLGELQ